MKRLPHVVAFLNAYSQGMSGGDAYFIEIARRTMGYRPTIVTSRLGCEICIKHGLEGDFRVTTREAVFRRALLTYLLRIIKSIGCVLTLESPDILYATSDFLPDVFAAFLAKLLFTKARWVQHIYHLVPRSRPITHYAQRLSHALIRINADMVLCDNHLLAQDLVLQGLAPERVEVNYPGIDFGVYCTLEETDTEGRETNYDAVFLGRLHESKGIFDLLDAWQRVRQVYAGRRLAIIGRGHERVEAALRKEIERRDLGQDVSLLGFLDTPEAVKVLRRSHVFVFPSHEEGFGMAVLEAMACGLPVVAWDLPVYREVFPEGMIWVPPGDNARLARAILELLGDEPLRKRTAQAGRRAIARFDWSRRAEREVELLRRHGISLQADDMEPLVSTARFSPLSAETLKGAHGETGD